MQIQLCELDAELLFLGLQVCDAGVDGSQMLLHLRPGIDLRELCLDHVQLGLRRGALFLRCAVDVRELFPELVQLHRIGAGVRRHLPRRRGGDAVRHLAQVAAERFQPVSAVGNLPHTGFLARLCFLDEGGKLFAALRDGLDFVGLVGVEPGF